MKVKEINYLVPPTDSVNDCLDVFVILQYDYCTSEFSYLVEVTTPEFLSAFMGKFKADFVPLGYPYIIVSKLTYKIIQPAIQACALDEAYWLKFYHFAGKVDTAVFNQLQTEHMEYLKELDQLDNSQILTYFRNSFLFLYDLDKKVIAVFKKSTGKFVTTSQLDDAEEKELFKTGNFGGKEGWFSWKVRNLPP